MQFLELLPTCCLSVLVHDPGSLHVCWAEMPYENNVQLNLGTNWYNKGEETERQRDQHKKSLQV